MMEQMGFCSGIENYSRHLSGRKAGEAPPTLIDYFPEDFLLVVDESHQTVPQLQAMYRGDRARKETLVDYGFRLPSALDNRPLKFEEFEAHVTPGDLRLGDARRVRAAEGAGRRRRAADPPDGPDRPRGGSAAGLGAGGRSPRRDQGPLQEERACPRDDAHEADVRGPHRLLPRARRAGAVPALGHRYARAHRHPARPAPRRVRRAGRDQPPARGARFTRGVARRDLRRRQGGLPAQPAVAHPDHRPRGTQPERPGHHVRRQGHARDGARARGDEPPAYRAAAVQRSTTASCRRRSCARS